MEKFTTEQIEQYLEDKLNVNERLEMEEAMAQNPELKEEVTLQKVLVTKLQEQALRTLAQEAHLRYMKGSSGSGISPNGKWILGITVFVIALATLMLYVVKSNTNSNVHAAEKTKSGSTGISDKDAIQLPVVKGTLEKMNPDFPEVSFMVYTFFADKGAEIKDPRSGTVIKISANSLMHANGTSVKGKVLLKYREFRNQADIVLSGIPMTYNGHNFNSAGMFEIYALQNNDTLDIKNQSAISVNFVMTKNEAGIGFYQLDQQKKQWEFIRALQQSEMVDFGETAVIGENKIQPFGFIQGDIKDVFLRSLGYQAAALDGKTHIPEVPAKPQGDFNKLYADKKYKQIAGSDSTTASNRIVVEELNKQLKKKESGFAAFFKKIFASGGAIVIPLDDKPKVDTSLSIAVKDKRYTIFENGNNIVMKELVPLKGTQFLYNGDGNFDALTKMAIYDVRLTRDTTVLNRFVLELKTDEGLLKYQLQLKNPDFTSFEEYDKLQRLRMLAYDNRVKLKEKEYQDLIQLRKERKDLVDSLSFYGNESIFRMARLIMTEDELRMSQEQWFASLDTNKTLRARIDAELDSIEAHGDNADLYIMKLARERNQSIRNVAANITVDAGHYFNPLVVNLKIKGFGVYNCDQVYRIQNPVAIRGKYVNEENVEIKQFLSLSVIDAKVNGAFSFDPALFTCSASADNILLLFTQDKKIYFFDKVKWKAKQIKKGGFYIFEMTDITARVKTSADLQKILEESPL